MGRRGTAPAAGSNRNVGLPIVLSLAGLLVAVLIAGSTVLESWLTSRAQGDREPGNDVPERGLGDPSRIDRLQSTVGSLEVKIEQLVVDNDRLSRQLADLEAQFGPMTASIAQQRQHNIDQGVANDRKADRVSVHFATPRKKAPATLTSSTSPPVAPTQTLFALQLPSFRNVAELARAWESIRGRSGNVLIGLEARAHPVRDDRVGVAYRLLVGPIRNAGDAAVRCVRLGEIGIPCETTVFAGERIAELVDDQ